MVVEVIIVRTEMKVGLLLNAIGIIFSRFGILPINANEFLSGLFMSLGILALVIGSIPESTYNNLLYRKWLANRG